ncbi:MAG: WD40 repeat domain-containing protein, partial [Anaerolineales bacterium]
RVFSSSKHSGNVSVAYSVDGQTMASVGAVDIAIRIWDVKNNRRLGLLADDGRTLVIQGIALSPDGRILFAASSDGRLRAWRLDTYQLKSVAEIA